MRRLCVSPSTLDAKKEFPHPPPWGPNKTRACCSMLRVSVHCGGFPPASIVRSSYAGIMTARTAASIAASLRTQRLFDGAVTPGPGHGRFW